jgi:hypothetical protein
MQQQLNNNKRILVGRIDFANGGSLDGELLSELLLRLRRLESRTSPPIPPGNVSYEFIDYDATTANWIDNQLQTYPAVIIVFSFTTDTTIESTYLGSGLPDQTYFRFSNHGTANIMLTDGTNEIVTVVPGENIKIMKVSSGWYLDSAL